MGPGVYQPPTLGQMVLVVVGFTVVTTVISMLVWTVIRRSRQRPHRPLMWLVTAVLSAVVSGFDVSRSTIANGGMSGIYSIFGGLVLSVYVIAIVIFVAIAAWRAK